MRREQLDTDDVLFLCGACQRQIETQIVCEFEGNAAVLGQVHCVENLKESIALRSARAPWRDSVLQRWGLQPVALRARTNLKGRNPAQNQNNASAPKPSATSASDLTDDQRLRCFALQCKVSSAKATARKRASCIEFLVPKIIKLI